MDRRTGVPQVFDGKYKPNGVTEELATNLVELAKRSGLKIVFESREKPDCKPEYMFEEEKHPALHMYEQTLLEYEKLRIE